MTKAIYFRDACYVYYTGLNINRHCTLQAFLTVRVTDAA